MIQRFIFLDNSTTIFILVFQFCSGKSYRQATLLFFVMRLFFPSLLFCWNQFHQPFFWFGPTPNLHWWWCFLIPFLGQLKPKWKREIQNVVVYVNKLYTGLDASKIFYYKLFVSLTERRVLSKCLVIRTWFQFPLLFWFFEADIVLGLPKIKRRPLQCNAMCECDGLVVHRSSSVFLLFPQVLNFPSNGIDHGQKQNLTTREKTW